MAFNRLGDWSTLSSDQQKAAVNKLREDKGTETGSVSRVSYRDRWHRGGNHSPCVVLEMRHQGSF